MKKSFFDVCKKNVSIAFVIVFCLTFFAGCGTKQSRYAKIEETDIAELSIFAYDGKSESKYGIKNFGHAFLSVKNISNESISVMGFVLNKNEMVTIGTWSISAHFGVWFNVESNFVESYNKYDGRVSATIGIDKDNIEDISKYLTNNDKWTPLKNCSYFATQLWNMVAEENEKIDIGYIYTPANLTSQIKLFDGYKENQKLETISYFGYMANGEFENFSFGGNYEDF